MTSDDNTALLSDFQNRRADIADRWYRATAHTCFISSSVADVRQAFATLTGQIIDLLFTEAFDRQQAQTIGATLAGLVSAQPEALGRTQEALAHELVAAVPLQQRPAFYERMALLLGEVRVGFTRQLRATVLAEQEQIRAARAEQRKQVEAALRASEQRLRMVMTNAPIVLFALDCHGVVMLAEGRGLAALGLDAEAIIGQSILDIKGITQQIVENIHHALSGEAFTDIVELDARVFETRYAPLHDEQEQVVGVIGVAVDITERRRLQRELEALRRQHALVNTLPLSTDDPAVNLTRREWNVIHLIVAGKTNREIALALAISMKTVAKHTCSVYSKLGVHSRGAVICWALHRTATTPPDLPKR